MESPVRKSALSGALGGGLAGLGWAMNYYEWAVPWFVAPVILLGSLVLVVYAAYGFGRLAWAWLRPKAKFLHGWRLRWPLFRSERISQVPLSDRIHIYKVDVALGPLDDDKYFKITLIGFNGTPRNYHVDSVEGAITYPMKTDGKVETVQLSKPNLTRMPWGDVKEYRKFAIELEQRAESKIANDILTRLSEGSMVEIRLGGLSITLKSEDKIPVRVPLALWTAMSIKKVEHIVTGEIIEARGALRAGASVIGG